MVSKHKEMLFLIGGITICVVLIGTAIFSIRFIATSIKSTTEEGIRHNIPATHIDIDGLKKLGIVQ